MLYPLSYGSLAGWDQPVGLHKLLMARTARYSPAARSNGRSIWRVAVGLARFRWGFQRNATQTMPLSHRPNFGTSEVTLQCPVTGPTKSFTRYGAPRVQHV